MEMNMFELAAREKFRFPYKGSIATEDLFDLSLTALDAIFKELNAKKKQANEESLLETKSREDQILDVKIDIIKYVVAVKKQENADRLAAREKRERNQRIMEIIAEKEDAALQNLSIDELKSMLN